MAKNIEFKANNVSAFITWLKKFSIVESSLLLEIDLNESMFIAKTYNEERSVVKYSKLDFEEAGFNLKTKKTKELSERLKVGVYNIIQLIKTLQHFDGTEFNITFNYDILIEEDDSKTLSGVSILIKNDNLKINIQCSPLKVFKYISDELFENNIANINSKINFDINENLIEKINSLSKLDNDNDYLKFKNKSDGNFFIRGKTFEQFLIKSNLEEDIEIDIFKEQFSKIDKDNYTCKTGEDRLIFTSETETIVISEIERNDMYEEDSKENPFD